MPAPNLIKDAGVTLKVITMLGKARDIDGLLEWYDSKPDPYTGRGHIWDVANAERWKALNLPEWVVNPNGWTRIVCPEPDPFGNGSWPYLVQVT